MTAEIKNKVLFVEWCAADALDGTLQMDPMTELAYRRILDMIYSTNDNLIDDDSVLQYSTKAGAKWKAIKKSLIDVHGKIYIEDGRIRNRTCTEKIEKARKNIAQKAAAAHAKHEKDKSLKNNKARSAAAHASADAGAHANQEPNNQEIEDAVDARAQDAPPDQAKNVSCETKIEQENARPECVGAAEQKTRADIGAMGDAIAEITGWADDPRWFGNYSRLGAWIAEGWDFEMDILPTVRRVMANRKANGRGPPGDLAYFERACADAFANRTAPVKEGRADEQGFNRNRNPQSAVEGAFAGFARAKMPDDLSGF